MLVVMTDSPRPSRASRFTDSGQKDSNQSPVWHDVPRAHHHCTTGSHWWSSSGAPGGAGADGPCARYAVALCATCRSSTASSPTASNAISSTCADTANPRGRARTSTASATISTTSIVSPPRCGRSAAPLRSSLLGHSSGRPDRALVRPRASRRIRSHRRRQPVHRPGLRVPRVKAMLARGLSWWRRSFRSQSARSAVDQPRIPRSWPRMPTTRASSTRPRRGLVYRGHGGAGQLIEHRRDHHRLPAGRRSASPRSRLRRLPPPRHARGAKAAAGLRSSTTRSSTSLPTNGRKSSGTCSRGWIFG